MIFCGGAWGGMLWQNLNRNREAGLAPLNLQVAFCQESKRRHSMLTTFNVVKISYGPVRALASSKSALRSRGFPNTTECSARLRLNPVSWGRRSCRHPPIRSCPTSSRAKAVRGPLPRPSMLVSANLISLAATPTKIASPQTDQHLAHVRFDELIRPSP
jgi:hypothetical protein